MKLWYAKKFFSPTWETLKLFNRIESADQPVNRDKLVTVHEQVNNDPKLAARNLML